MASSDSIFSRICAITSADLRTSLPYESFSPTMSTANNSTPHTDLETVVGVTLAVMSGLFLGSSVVLRKRGLIEIAADGHNVAEGSTAYLKNRFWWAGMGLQAIGEISNFGAYALCPTVIVTPMGTLAVVFNSLLSNYLLKEKLSFIGKLGCGICILGVLEIVTHVLTDREIFTIPQFMVYVTSTSFLVYSAFIVVLVLFLKFYAEPRYAKKTPFVYIAMSSCGGSYLVLSAQGVGSAIACSIKNWTTDNQFVQWPLYPLILFMVMAVIYQITYLNKALSVNSSAVIYPISFVCFNIMTMISTAFLYFKLPVDNVEDGISVIVGLLTIICGVVLLSISKHESKMIIEHDRVDNISTEKLLRRSTKNSLESNPLSFRMISITAASTEVLTLSRDRLRIGIESSLDALDSKFCQKQPSVFEGTLTPVMEQNNVFEGSSSKKVSDSDEIRNQSSDTPQYENEALNIRVQPKPPSSRRNSLPQIRTFMNSNNYLDRKRVFSEIQAQDNIPQRSLVAHAYDTRFVSVSSLLM